MHCCLEIYAGYAAWLAMLSIDMLAGWLFGWLFVYDLWLAAYAGVAGYAVWLTNLAAYPRWF